MKNIVYTTKEFIFKKGVIIDTPKKLKKLAHKMQNIQEFAYDTEFNTLKVHGDNSKFRLVDISISWGEYDNYIIPCGHVLDTKQVTPKDIRKYLKDIFERKDVVIIGHNIKIDMHSLARIGIKIQTPYLFDTMIASWICNENERKGLKDNTQRIFGVDQTHFNDVLSTVTKEEKKMFGLKGNQKPTIDLVRIENGAPYALMDAYFTWKLYLYYLEELKKEEMETIYYNTYPPFIYTLYNMEEKGITVDEEKLKAMGEEMQKDLDRLEYEMLSLAGVQMELTSNQQLNQLLYGYKEYKNVREDILENSFKFPIVSKTAKGAPQCNNDSLLKLCKNEYKTKRKKEGIEFCKLLLEYKKLSKLKTAFVDGLLDCIYEDGRSHPSFNIVGTDSGRISCSSPNLMQLPNAKDDDKYKIRECFIGGIDKTGERMDIISVDYSNLEVRVIAHFSKDPALLKAFAEGKDLHGNTAKMMFGLDCDANDVKKLHPDLRQQGKVIAFLLQYGGSSYTLYNDLNGNGELDDIAKKVKGKKRNELPQNIKDFAGCKDGKAVAQKLMDMYFDSFKGIATFMKHQKRFAHRNGYVYTLVGRKRRLPEINSSDFKRVGYNERLSINACIQGCNDINTPILTTKGYVLIKDLDPDKHSLVTSTLSNTHNYKVWNSGSKQLYKMTSLHSVNEVSKDHRFGVYEDGEIIFKRLKDLSVGDIIAYTHLPSQNIHVNKDMTIHEFIGACIGDGNYSNRNMVRLCGGRDKLEYLRMCKALVEREIGYNLSIVPTSGSIGECYQFTTENKEFRYKLLKLGLDKVSKNNKDIPNYYMTSDMQTKCELLRGLFNTDGGWSRNELTYTSKVQAISYKVHLLLNSLGINNRYKEQNNRVYRVFVEKSDYVKFNDLIGFKVKTKNDKLISCINEGCHTIELVPLNLCKEVWKLVRNENVKLVQADSSLLCRLNKYGGTKQSCVKFLNMCTSDKAKKLIELLKITWFTKIMSIKPTGVKPTLDIEIYENDHSYIASTLLNHNSGADIMINAQNKIDGTIIKAPISTALQNEFFERGKDIKIGSERLKELGCTMLVQIHDELLFECPKDNCDEAMAIIRDYMINPFGEKVKLNLDLEVGMGHGQSYQNGH